jgi:acetyl esterase/lipase
LCKDGISSSEFYIPTRDSQTVPARIYRASGETSKLPLYIHLHGGGFHLGNLETEDTGCRLISLHTKIAVLNLNYRHSPEWTFPTPVQDVWDALDWISQPCNLEKYNIDENQIIIGGTSAGASLACAATLHDLQYVRGNIPPRSQPARGHY